MPKGFRDWQHNADEANRINARLAVECNDAAANAQAAASRVVTDATMKVYAREQSTREEAAKEGLKVREQRDSLLAVTEMLEQSNANLPKDMAAAEEIEKAKAAQVDGELQHLRSKADEMSKVTTG